MSGGISKSSGILVDYRLMRYGRGFLPLSSRSSVLQVLYVSLLQHSWMKWMTNPTPLPNLLASLTVNPVIWFSCVGARINLKSDGNIFYNYSVILHRANRGRNDSHKQLLVSLFVLFKEELSYWFKSRGNSIQSHSHCSYGWEEFACPFESSASEAAYLLSQLKQSD